MMIVWRFIKQLHVSDRFFYGIAGLALLFVLGYFIPAAGVAGELLLLVFGVMVITDILLLYSKKQPFSGNRNTPRRLSNGDENTIHLHLQSHYPFTIQSEIIDEVPHQFQLRDFSIRTSFMAGSERSMSYSLRPVMRGAYEFGNINIFVRSRLGIIQRKLRIDAAETVPVYPSFIQMRKYEMYAISNRLTDAGIKKIRRLGHTMEFDQIKEYVPGDDVRSINWKATARANNLMVNQYQDERSQNVISIIDKGRVMKMPFEGMHLLDYAINSSLIISNIALLKNDKAGLCTFSHQDSMVLKPQRKRTHIRNIQHALYNLQTNFLESDFEQLVMALNRHVKQRSLILLYTNFETFSAMERQLPYLQHIAKKHLLVTIFFENTELNQLQHTPFKNTEEIYTGIVAEKLRLEKKHIVKELQQLGIQSILTSPEQLSVATINKYLQLKARGF